MNVVKTYPKLPGTGIRSFYSVQGYYAATNARLPDGTLDVVFNLGDTVSYAADGVNYTPMPAVALTGLYSERKFLAFSGVVHLVGVVFEPGFAHRFVNDALHYYQDCAADASIVFGNSIAGLHERLSSIATEHERHSMLEMYFHRYATRLPGDHYSATINEAARQIQLAQGNVDISVMHREFCMSERNFRRRFTEYVGMAPKQYAVITRVKAFSKKYETQRGLYSDLFMSMGYSDPSHFSKDFRKVAGMSPSAYFIALDALGTEFIHLI